MSGSFSDGGIWRGLALEAGYLRLALRALAEIGDLRKLLAQSRPPGFKRIGEAHVSQGAFGFEVRFQVKDRGGGRVEYRVDGVVVGQADFRGRFGLGLPNRYLWKPLLSSGFIKSDLFPVFPSYRMPCCVGPFTRKPHQAQPGAVCGSRGGIACAIASKIALTC